MNNRLNESSTIIKSLGFGTIWSGAAYERQSESYNDVITKLDKAIEEVKTFDEASEKLVTYKQICERIQSLYNSISSCSSRHTEEQEKTGCNNCSMCSYEISQKESERTILRNQIKGLLSKIVGIEVELEAPTNFNPTIIEILEPPETPDLLPNYDPTAITNSNYDGRVLSPSQGRNDNGPQGCETWYDLNMSYVVERMETVYGKPIETWIDPETGIKMCTPVGGDGTAYVMVAADTESVWGNGNNVNPDSTYHMGDTVQTSWGPGMVVDYCELAVNKRKAGAENHFDIATAWGSGYYDIGQNAADRKNESNSNSDELNED